jgi:hypothetical protein
MHFASEALEKKVQARLDLQRLTSSPVIQSLIRSDELKQWQTDMICLAQAQPYYFSARCTDLIVQAMQDFNLAEIDASRHMVYTDTGFCWFGEKAPFELESFPEKERFPVKAISWYVFSMRSIPYIGMTAFAHNPLGEVMPTIWSCTDLGNKMNSQIDGPRLSFKGFFDERTNWEIDQMKKFVCASGTFMRQKLMAVERVPLERHARKRLAKLGNPKEQDHVSVVSLRRSASKEKSHQTDVQSSREFAWQWTVRGHVRQQFYATLNEHLPVYIHPYLKGPEDKPLKPRSTPIYSVSK